jgi:hypothetical protein
VVAPVGVHTVAELKSHKFWGLKDLLTLKIGDRLELSQFCDQKG